MRVGVFGAGLVGSTLGVELSAAGMPVVLLCRPHSARAREHLQVVTLAGQTLRPGPDLVARTDPDALRDVDVCLVTVKSGDTAAAAEVLRDVLDEGTLVVSFQNGLHNAELLRSYLRGPVSAGVVNSNLYWQDELTIRQATGGALYVGALGGSQDERLRSLRRSFHLVGQSMALRRRIDRVLAGKLLLNLNNGVCAATGLGIAELLDSRDARWCFARCLREGWDVMYRAGIRPARVTALPPRLLPHLLALPDAALRLLGRRLAPVEAGARSSTLQDLERGRRTEIDVLNGEVVKLGRRLGIAVPGNTAVVTTVNALEGEVERGEQIRFVSPQELRRRIEAERCRQRDATTDDEART